jgi:HPr kinase/phosphorylase
MHQDITKPASPDSDRPATLQLHGVLVRVFGTGVLLIGESGIGKSESALDLITRGHQLIADDVVDVTGTSDGLVGRAPETIFGLLEIRGLGVFDVRKAFGYGATLTESSIDLCIELRKDADAERVGNFVHEYEIARRRIPRFIMAVTPGRNLAILVETAVRLYLTRHDGAAAGDALLAEDQGQTAPF